MAIRGTRLSQRTNEIGIRMALGAERSQVLGMVLRQGFWIVLAGLCKLTKNTTAVLSKMRQPAVFLTCSAHSEQ